MTKAPLLLRLSYRLYGLLLLAYPRAFRREYGEPMLQLFRDSCASSYPDGGSRALAHLWWCTLGDLVATVPREHLSPARVRPPVPSGLTLPVTPRAWRSLEIARQEAAAAGRAEVSPEHVLLGLIGEGRGARIGKETGVAGRVLRDLSLSMSPARQAVLHRPPPPQPQDAGSADSLLTLMRHAEAEARRLGHPFVGTEHVLLCLLADHEPTFAAFFDSFGVSVERVRYHTLGLIGAWITGPGDQ